MAQLKNPQMMQAMNAMQKMNDKPLAGKIAKSHNLNNLIKTIKVLNRCDEESTVSDKMFGSILNPISSQFIVSDCDEQLLILIEFRDPVDLDSMSIHALKEKKENDDEDDEDEECAAPKNISLFRIEDISKNFDDATKLKADYKFKCKMDKLKSTDGHVAKLKKKAKSAVKFGKLEKLMIFIKDNQSECEKTFISGIKLREFA